MNKATSVASVAIGGALAVIGGADLLRAGLSSGLSHLSTIFSQAAQFADAPAAHIMPIVEAVARTSAVIAGLGTGAFAGFSASMRIDPPNFTLLGGSGSGRMPRWAHVALLAATTLGGARGGYVVVDHFLPQGDGKGRNVLPLQTMPKAPVHVERRPNPELTI